MSTSWILFFSAFGCGLLFAGCAWIAQLGPAEAPAGAKLRKGEPPPRRKRRWVMPVAILAVCTALGAGAFLIDSGVADSTLYEVVADGTGPNAPETFRFEIPVEHAEVEHELLVEPKSEAGVDGPVDLRVQLVDPSGRVLVDRTETLDTRCEDTFCEWRSFSATFTPGRTGPHTLQVTVATPNVPTLHVHVSDPEKTDGQRAPGY